VDILGRSYVSVDDRINMPAKKNYRKITSKMKNRNCHTAGNSSKILSKTVEAKA
jgi:hypothetical protein